MNETGTPGLLGAGQPRQIFTFTKALGHLGLDVHASVQGATCTLRGETGGTSARLLMLNKLLEHHDIHCLI